MAMHALRTSRLRSARILGIAVCAFAADSSSQELCWCGRGPAKHNNLQLLLPTAFILGWNIELGLATPLPRQASDSRGTFCLQCHQATLQSLVNEQQKRSASDMSSITSRTFAAYHLLLVPAHGSR